MVFYRDFAVTTGVIGGTVIMKCGSYLFGVQNFFQYIGMEDYINTAWFGAASMVLVFPSVAYTTLWTRGIPVHQKFKNLCHAQSESQGSSFAHDAKNYVKCNFRDISLLFFVLLAGLSFITMLCYTGVVTILKGITQSGEVENNSLVIYPFFSYVLMSDYTVYCCFLLWKVIGNAHHLSQQLGFSADYGDEMRQERRLILAKTLATTALGLISNGMFIYFISIPFVQKFIGYKSPAIAIAVLSTFVWFFAKVGNVYKFFEGAQKKHPLAVALKFSRCSALYLVSQVVGWLYLAAVTLGYYASGVFSIKEFVDLDDISIAMRAVMYSMIMVVTLSSSFMEYQFTYSIMLENVLNEMKKVPGQPLSGGLLSMSLQNE